MSKKDLVITKLEGYSGIRLQNKQPLHFKPGINLLVGRNGSGKTNLLRLIQSISLKQPKIESYIETSFFAQKSKNILSTNTEKVSSDFSEIEVVNFSFNGHPGIISISLKDNITKSSLKSIIEPGASIEGQIITNKYGPVFRWKPIYGNGSSLKLDFGGSININVLSKNSDRDIGSVIEQSIDSINQFVFRKVFEFFNSSEFDQELRNLEDQINKKLEAFLGTTNKKIHIHKSSNSYMSVKPILLDRGNEIKPERISSGENALLNLVFNLTTETGNPSDVLSFDEPETHMHDDMIEVFIKEIVSLHRNAPDTKILIATHSTSLIEKLAFYGSGTTNLIVFNDKREVANSQEDIEMINALNRNGVWFSPLMLSKRHNLYIENQGRGKTSHKDFFSKFFDAQNRPNVIPIGSGASVEQSQSFSDTLQELLKSSDIKSKGIRDGDIWIKENLIQYLSGRIDLDDFISLLTSFPDLYIRVDKKKKGANPDFYFNFWEIENLYIMEELLHNWVSNGKHLSVSIINTILEENVDLLASEFLETYYKTFYPRPNKKHSLQKKISSMNKKLDAATEVLKNEKELTERAESLVGELIKSDKIRWLPGKEIYNLLGKLGYVYIDSGQNYDQLDLSKKVREILEL